jgi:hypothetical protein
MESKLRPEQVVEMLRKKGMEVTVEQAVMVLEFLQLLATIVVSQYLKKH